MAADPPVSAAARAGRRPWGPARLHPTVAGGAGGCPAGRGLCCRVGRPERRSVAGGPAGCGTGPAPCSPPHPHSHRRRGYRRQARRPAARSGCRRGRARRPPGGGGAQLPPADARAAPGSAAGSGGATDCRCPVASGGRPCASHVGGVGQGAEPLPRRGHGFVLLRLCRGGVCRGA
ncbi:hypothetical protein I4F81_012931 [Pyropia yezoensis]|uniref:Uncharacterized protein n=1 Tax=Pyropia yezoensis TaxID=2788 RepID=A0ABQ9T853_PYRYE|nr:hypothetical protein I4F81_012931 [Neopyropia yezoensis]